MDLVERMFRVLIGKHLAGQEQIKPGINDWNIEASQVEGNNYKVVFHSGKKNVLKVDMGDLDIISSVFFTKDLNLGSENKVHNGCKTCDYGSDYQVVIHVNNAGVAPKIERNFCFAWIKREKMGGETFYYKDLSQTLREQCAEAWQDHSKVLEMI
jgi:hypothetical protein